MPRDSKAASRPSNPRRDKPHPALDYPKIASFVAELRQQDGVPARALEFAILTAARTAAVTGATWDEIDINAKLWTIPRERMMTGKERRVPLSDATVMILKKP
jgi:integrase